MPDEPVNIGVVTSRLRLGTGFEECERAALIERLEGLGKRLGSFPEDTLDLELSVKERDGADQHLTLECWMAGQERLVSTSTRTPLTRALIEVRDDMVRQISDATNRRQPGGDRRDRPVARVRHQGRRVSSVGPIGASLLPPTRGAHAGHDPDPMCSAAPPSSRGRRRGGRRRPRPPRWRSCRGSTPSSVSGSSRRS